MSVPQQQNTKQTSPSIYSLILEGKGITFLSIQFAYSLEDAFSMAQNEFIRQNPKASPEVMQGARINLFAIKTIDQLFAKTKIIEKESEPGVLLPGQAIKVQVPVRRSRIKEGPKEVIKEVSLTKNELMHKIINDKDFKLLKISTNIFTKAEIKFLKEKLKKTLDK
jgi:hypothetical protein